MNYIDRFLSWAREHTGHIIGGGIGIAFIVIFVLYTIFWGTTGNQYCGSPMVSINETSTKSGAQRLYSIVREGDDLYLKGDYQKAWDYYADTHSALRELQTEFPDRSAQYRDAERVVQNRMYLAEIADSLKQIMPNQTNSADAKSHAAD